MTNFELQKIGSHEMKNRVLRADELDVVVEDVFEPPARGLSEDADLHVLPELSYRTKRGISTEEAFENTLKVLMKNVKTLHLVCFHLPISVKRVTGGIKSFEVSWADSLMAKSEGSVANTMGTHWLGTLSIPGAPVTESEKAELIGS